MGKKKFKQQEKTKVEYVIDNTVTNKVCAKKVNEIRRINVRYLIFLQIVVDIAQNEYSGALDGTNALVLPSAKRDTKVKVKERKVTRILSKKQRKKLEKIVDKKHKKENVCTRYSNYKTVA